MAKGEQVKTMKRLKELAVRGQDFVVMLNGNLRSSKHVIYDEALELFHIHNLIDDSEVTLTDAEISSGNSIVIHAMNTGALYTD